jgi:FAS-associated factor 2
MPLNYIINKCLPYYDDRDGLAPAVTAKSAQQCISYLQALAVASSSRHNTAGNSSNSNSSSSAGSNTSNPNHTQLIERIGEAWCNLGFIALKQEAQATQSILVIYIHSPIHSDTKDFCRTTLNSEAFLSYIQQDRILAVAYSIHTAQGLQLQNILQITTFPAMVVLQPSSNTSSASSSSPSLQLVIKAQGKKQCHLTSIMPYLHAVYQRHLITINEIEIRRIQRQQEQELRQQQDMEYQATLAADQERERLLAEERNAILVAAAAQQEKERNIQLLEEKALQAAKDLLRPEPEANTTAPTTMIRFVLPSGIKMNRRFYSDETVASLRAYLHIYFVEQSSHPNPTTGSHDNQQQQHHGRIKNIGLSTNFPRQSFNNLEVDNGKTLMELGLVPQAVLMVQDLDA